MCSLGLPCFGEIRAPSGKEPVQRADHNCNGPSCPEKMPRMSLLYRICSCFSGSRVPLVALAFSPIFCRPSLPSSFSHSLGATSVFSEVDSISLPSRSEILCPFLPHLTYRGQSKLQSFFAFPKMDEKGSFASNIVRNSYKINLKFTVYRI